jgi:hypothetical protein
VIHRQREGVLHWHNIVLFRVKKCSAIAIKLIQRSGICTEICPIDFQDEAKRSAVAA